MPNKKDKKATGTEKTEQAGDGVLTKVASAVGSALGTIAAKAGIGTPNTAKTPRIGKLVKKNKAKLPRKQKKAQKKAAAKSFPAA